MPTPKEILQHYWGYPDFRPLQEDIINSVLNGKDTLALLPTGGGKSLCYQVPALALEGLTLVISPLIALMKDQVEQLKTRKIKAEALFSGLTGREISLILDNCAYGEVKLLYVAPERLASEKFREELKRFTISMVAIDEAHCISQWGYDFRPAYLRIAELRELLTDIPVIALTATATTRVVSDIQEKLQFNEGKVFRQSFARNNISLVVRSEGDKMAALNKIATGVKGCGLVYVRNRKRCREIAQFLQSEGHAASFYHAGLKPEERQKRQDDWMSGNVRIMVCTNAFGMGIDKPDVRFVAHADLPDSLEAYYQEAGRAGRDGKPSYAVILFNQPDVEVLVKKIEEEFPDIKEVQKIYQAMANFLQIAIGSADGRSYHFDFYKFCANYQWNTSRVFHAIRLMEQGGLLTMNDGAFIRSRIRVTGSRELIYQIGLKNVDKEKVLQALLRSLPGVFDHYISFSEERMAKQLKIKESEVKSVLQSLNRMGVAHYIPKPETAILTYLTPRQDADNLSLSRSYVNERQELHTQRIDAVINYAANNSKCRSRVMLAYFGEKESEDCGKCDVCRASKVSVAGTGGSLKSRISNEIRSRAIKLTDLLARFPGIDRKTVGNIVRALIDEGQVTMNEEDQLIWIVKNT